MERIYVTVRARPLSAEDAKCSPWRIAGNSVYLASQSAKFDFDRVFGEECKTREVYEARTKEIVASAVRGFNGTVFAYGQTNSGKTHTMRGSETEPGIIPMAVHDLFQSMQENTDREFLVRIAYMEIYNEEINDLLTPEHRRLQIHESLERGIFVAGLKEEIVSSPEQVLELMEKGESLRHIGETNMNLHSSRSHTIFRMTVESREKTDDSYGVDHLCDAVRVSVLNLVDLAGSERAAKTGAEGVRLKEGSHINKSLMTLGTVIKKLSEGAECQGGHVPYRDSKLTRILQPALGGNANTAIICNITLAQIHIEETKSSLQFASRALRVTNCACVNEILTDAALLRRQRKEIEELRARLLASHSEHWEQEILNLRNTLLQSELEKERIALELEEERKAKAQLEKRLQEQISNLSSMVLEMKGDNQSTKGNKDVRQNSWCSDPSTLKASTDARGKEHADLPLPFEDLLEESQVPVQDNICNHFLTVENIDSGDECTFPDARALLHVTSRRKVHRKKGSSPMGKEMHTETEIMEKESEYFQGKITSEAGCVMERDSEFTSSGSDATLCQLSAVGPNKYAILQELEAIARIELLQEQENLTASCVELTMEMQDIAFEVQNSSNVVQEISSVVEDLLRSFSDNFRTLQELKAFASLDMEQIKSIASSHEKLYGFMKRKGDEQEIEKQLLHQETSYLQKEIQELKFEAQEREKLMDEVIHQHESEKDELCRQILALQKEVSCLSSSSLTKERETLRKELEKAKLKLKDTESKLKNTIQDKVRLESEKAQAEREIKHLHGQWAIVQRDASKQDSLTRHESKAFDFNKPKVCNGPVNPTLQSDYEKLEIYAFEMEAEIASLGEKLIVSVGEKEEAFTRNGILEAELEALSDQLNTANSELKLMGEEIANLTLRLDESESLCQRLRTSHDFMLREKEEMEMQLTDVLLEFEAKKSTWLTERKALVDADEKCRNKIAMLSEDLIKVESELESCQNLCKNLLQKLLISEENAEAERKCSLVTSLEIANLRNELEQLELSRLICEDVLKATVGELSLERHYACEQVNKLQKQLTTYQERERSYSQSKMDIVPNRLEDVEGELLRARRNVEELSEKLFTMEVKSHNETRSNNIEKTKLRMKLRSTQAKLDAFRGRYMEAIDEMELMNRKFEAASTKLKEQLASYGIEILNLKKQLSTKD